MVATRRHFGAGHVRTAVVLCNLAWVRLKLGDAKCAEVLLRRGLDVQEAYFGKDHVELADTLSNLGLAHGKLGELRKELAELQRSMTLQERHFGADHPAVATSLAHLAEAHGALGRPRKMKRMLARSLRMLDRRFGAGHQHSCLVLSALSTASVALRQLRSARLACASSLRASGGQPGQENGQLRGLVLLRGAAVAAARGSARGAAGSLRRGVSALKRALGVVAAVRVAQLEVRRMVEICGASGRADVARTLQAAWARRRSVEAVARGARRKRKAEGQGRVEARQKRR